jgi:uncharacterized membrane protein YhaH (DUF805 family)
VGNAISACMKKYATFEGRATRSEYWFFYLFYVIMYLAGTVIGAANGSSTVMYIFILPFWLPSLAAAVRRLHDSGRTGWLILVPIYNLVLLCTPGDPGPNRYGSY